MCADPRPAVSQPLAALAPTETSFSGNGAHRLLVAAEIGKALAVPRLALSPDEAAMSLGVSRDFFDEHIVAEIRIVRRGRRKLVPVREVERWLAESSARVLEAS